MFSEPSASNFAILDYYIPSDLITFPPIPPSTTAGLCGNDEDLGSGGVLLPPNYQYTGNIDQCSAGCNVVINADKQSNLYATNQMSLGGYAGPSTTACPGNNIQCITTPAPIPANDLSQGYWGSPVYLWYTNGGHTYNMLYYSVDAPNTVGLHGGPGMSLVAPMPINGYLLQPSGSPGPIPATPTASTSTLFCGYSPTPSVSSNGTATPASGIVWAIEENQNADNNPSYQRQPDCAGTQPPLRPVALHAFCATAGSPECPTALTEIYNSRKLSLRNQPGSANAFPTPTVFNGQVYMGTNAEIDVFGICPQPPGGCLK
jgi:hypothetical protein